MDEENVVKDYDVLYACDVEDIERKAIKRYQEEEHYERNYRARERNKIRREQEEKRRYFLNQKMIGLFLLLASFALAFTVDLVCLAGIIPSVAIIFTKKMVIVDDYWQAHGGDEQWDDLFNGD